jgi:hypothetical protein
MMNVNLHLGVGGGPLQINDEKLHENNDPLRFAISFGLQ